MISDLTPQLLRLFREGVSTPLSDEEFDALALRAFEHQAEANTAYGAFARARGLSPEAVDCWERVPPVPARAFKELPLVAGDAREVQKIFRTSGTTGGREKRGAHHVLDLQLYHAALLSNFRAHLLPEERPLPILSLIPSPEELPDSSLSHMIGVVMEESGAEGSGYFVTGDGTIARDGLSRALRAAESRDRPVLVVGTAFAFVHWMDAADERGERFHLPGGSRIMETGGFKGRSRSVPRGELYSGLERRLGVPASRIVNEYGMTELLSQFYEPVLREADGVRRHRPPPWVRTRILDPVTLAPVSPGTEGLLCHFDLANVNSVCAVLTEDLGVAVGNGFRVLGRARGAEPRGCSLAMDELLSLAREV
jgi:hypothetical protein